MDTLKLDWCAYEAAKYAVTRWHYSKSMPAGKLAKIGVWEHGQFMGVVLFGRGANRNMAGSLGLKQTEVAELVRVALRGHVAPVTRIVRIAMVLLKANNPGLRCVFSYVDPEQGHVGTIYQAGNWIYVGTSDPQKVILVNEQFIHKRAVFGKYGTASVHWMKANVDTAAQRVQTTPKYKYLYPLDAGTRAQLESMRQPYPKPPFAESKGRKGSVA